ncbi:hypothetical protein FEM03_14995 [Phragmitibacter flavus]|uniref:HMA domain-containing protein n=1 Tax=Phragmitibacter flavus TaxID=2576071 RepID=A0A5R8KCL4_9BACT|nr:cation transporter [Phragmitibacter flavus]TLD70033.1 hypothetical protein FEM03_14995 [Phragmitibacter flavus]
MKSILCTAALLLTLNSLGHSADEGKSIPYTATVTGVVCGSCKAHVTEAFKKLPGVEEVRFAKGEKEGTQVVSFNAASTTLAKEDVVKTLGKDAARYEVLALEKSAD